VSTVMLTSSLEPDPAAAAGAWYTWLPSPALVPRGGLTSDTDSHSDADTSSDTDGNNNDKHIDLGIKYDPAAGTMARHTPAQTQTATPAQQHQQSRHVRQAPQHTRIHMYRYSVARRCEAGATAQGAAGQSATAVTCTTASGADATSQQEVHATPPLSPRGTSSCVRYHCDGQRRVERRRRQLRGCRPTDDATAGAHPQPRPHPRHARPTAVAPPEYVCMSWYERRRGGVTWEGRADRATVRGGPANIKCDANGVPRCLSHAARDTPPPVLATQRFVCEGGGGVRRSPVSHAGSAHPPQRPPFFVAGKTAQRRQRARQQRRQRWYTQRH
jgi:hypothetical protein